ncbi:hypothetical protein [Peredibacter starrii]|uniref:Uncharacterized protein n=1 Tax=Peredibacter starrii TaxID=28202 RepID=A0AAX4HLV9_9BACT|nr:hypothetical protein [Peredibacter starrii]WPU64244.1 hypothetical protein SOO65_16240 [Peredibacter starrii]
MNSLQKQTAKSVQDSHETFLVTFETNLLKMQDAVEVELLMKKLQYLGINFDPFQSEIESVCSQIMDQLGLTTHMKNPYLATNILLRLLDKTEERLNNLKQ